MQTPPFNPRQFYTAKAKLLEQAKADLAEMTKKLLNIDDLERSVSGKQFTDELEPLWAAVDELAIQLDSKLEELAPMVEAFVTEAELMRPEEPALVLPDLNKTPTLL